MRPGIHSFSDKAASPAVCQALFPAVKGKNKVPVLEQTWNSEINEQIRLISEC